MFSWSDEPFVCCPLHMLFSCVLLIFLWEDCSLGYQCWPLMVGIWALRAKRMETLLCFSFIPAGNTTGRVSGRQQLQVIPLHRVTWFCPAAPFPSQCCSRIPLYFCWPLPCLRSANRRWGQFLCPPTQEIDSTTFSSSSQMYFFLATCSPSSGSASWGTTCTATLTLTGGGRLQHTANAREL